MRRPVRHRAALAAAAAALLVIGVAGPAGAHGGPPPAPKPQATRLYVPPPPDGSLRQVAQLVRSKDYAGARALTRMITTPQAVWLTQGTPAEVRRTVSSTMRRAMFQHATPTFVVYDLPYRDCGQYSAGGAASTSAYQAFVDAVVKGIGNKAATVILEPDGLGLIPNYVSALDGTSNCTMPPDPSLPADAQPTPENRFAQLNYAVDAFAKSGKVSVYLDATHTSWQNVGESADRLVKAGAQRATGFFLNVSNYHYTANLVQYGTWVSRCMAYGTQVKPGAFNDCPNQYWNGGPSTGWNGVALDNMRVWSDGAADLAVNTQGINERYASGDLAAAVPTAHFVIDTSRNGQGPWKPPAGTYSDAQDWCNPPGRGAGDRPLLKPVAGNDLVDAYLWVKTPGQSDGQCSRGTGGTVDPEWGITDPAAGSWFPQQALQLATLAVPKL